MAISHNSTTHVKDSVASAVSALQGSDVDLWRLPVQSNDQAKALKVLGFAWTHLKPIVFPIFPKEPTRPEIIAAALETQTRVLTVMNLLSSRH